MYTCTKKFIFVGRFSSKHTKFAARNHPILTEFVGKIETLSIHVSAGNL